MALVPVPDTPVAAAAAAADASASAPREGMHGVLQWLCEQTPDAVTAAASHPDPEGAAAAAAGSPEEAEERRQFLSRVLASLHQDYLAETKAALAVLLDANSSDTEREDALEIVSDECEDINVATDFANLGGFAPVMSYLRGSSPGLQWRAADVVASLTQNCPAGQVQAREHGFLDLVVPLLDSADDKVRLKALRAVSCMVRGDEQLADELAQQPSRVAAVVACLRPPSPVRVQIKAAHLLHHLVQRSVEFSTMVLDAENVVGALEVALLDDDNAQLWEQGLYLLVALGARRNSLLSTLQTDHSSLLERMGARRSVLTALPAEDKDAHREELDHMATLLGAMQM